MKSVNHFMHREDYFIWSTKNIFKLTNILRRAKYIYIKKEKEK